MRLLTLTLLFPSRPLLFAFALRKGPWMCALHVNLPGWRWGTITQIPLVAVSRPLHSGVCETRQDAGLPVIHSAISDSGRLRTRGGQLPASPPPAEEMRGLRVSRGFHRLP